MPSCGKGTLSWVSYFKSEPKTQKKGKGYHWAATETIQKVQTQAVSLGAPGRKHMAHPESETGPIRAVTL